MRIQAIVRFCWTMSSVDMSWLFSVWQAMTQAWQPEQRSMSTAIPHLRSAICHVASEGEEPAVKMLMLGAPNLFDGAQGTAQPPFDAGLPAAGRWSPLRLHSR